MPLKQQGGVFRTRMKSLIWFLLAMAYFATAELEAPQYETVHEESSFEIRRYRPAVWMVSYQEDFSFFTATRHGFHRLFQYIQGANLNSSLVPMTRPVLTSIVPSDGPFCTSAFNVSFYVPQKFQADPPVPLAELKLNVERWDERCIAVRKFSGFARDENVAQEASLLAANLDKTPWANFSSGSYAIAQYNSPFEIFKRTNEVWISLSKCSTARHSIPLDLMANEKDAFVSLD